MPDNRRSLLPKFWITVLAAVSFLLLLYLPVRAQVSIKDTVVISAGRSLEPVEVLLSPSSEVVYVASDSGILAGQIELARKYVPIGSASLSIMLNDTTVLLEATDYVDRYLSWQSVQFRCNDPGTPIYYMEYHALSASGHALRFFLPEVHVGDTLRFLYRGSIPATEVVGNTVRMKLGDSCYFYYEGELQEKEVCEVQLSMLNSAFAGYIVQSEQDTIAVGDVSRLTVASVDSAGVEVPMDSTTLLSYTITPDSLGKFIKATGDTVSSPLPDVLYADARAGRIQFLAHGTPPDSLQPVVIEAVQTNDTTKRGADTIVIIPDSAEIEIISPLAGTTIDSSITMEPRMPQLKAKARLKNYHSGDVFFDWRFVLKSVNPQYDPDGTRLEDRVIRDSFEGKDTVQSADTSIWIIPWDQLIRGGDIDTLYVTALAGTQTFRDTVINSYRIRGSNPVRDSVKAGLSIQQQVVVYRESRWRQFNGSPGFPLYGRPRGYGLMQLDNPAATDQEVWHWRENRARGIALLATKYAEAVGLGARIRNRQSRQDWYPYAYSNANDLITDEQLWKETYQRYVGGSYWRWHPDRPRDPRSTGAWRAEPQGGHNRGNEDWQLYQDVLGGHPPADW